MPTCTRAGQWCHIRLGCAYAGAEALPGSQRSPLLDMGRHSTASACVHTGLHLEHNDCLPSRWVAAEQYVPVYVRPCATLPVRVSGACLVPVRLHIALSLGASPGIPCARPFAPCPVAGWCALAACIYPYFLEDKHCVHTIPSRSSRGASVRVQAMNGQSVGRAPSDKHSIT